MSSNPVVNIKYDAILSSSAAKGLALSPEFRPPPTPTVDADADADIDDARTPPNSPVGTVPAHQSLMAAAFGITSVGRMSREDEEEGVKVERGSDLERVGP
ncbi:hypothetical protein H0H92_005927 [Tricholoma furcatifolium]|nr:hypothetical protein H0H92_005927 [Tricholoma furcatifolium]